MKNAPYNAPVIDELQSEPTPVVATTQKPIAIQAIAEEVQPTSNESFWRSEVDKYMQFATNKKGYKTDKERIKENIAFMQRTGTMLSYDYPEFEDCILYLIQSLRNNPKAHSEGRFFRLIDGCEVEYSHAALAQYRMLVSWCIRIATCWPTRVKQAKGTDIESMIVGMRKEAKDNLNLFVRKMANFAIQ